MGFKAVAVEDEQLRLSVDDLQPGSGVTGLVAADAPDRGACRLVVGCEGTTGIAASVDDDQLFVEQW
jgi:hypothetical protein